MREFVFDSEGVPANEKVKNHCFRYYQNCFANELLINLLHTISTACCVQSYMSDSKYLFHRITFLTVDYNIAILQMVFNMMFLPVDLQTLFVFVCTDLSTIYWLTSIVKQLIFSLSLFLIF